MKKLFLDLKVFQANFSDKEFSFEDYPSKEFSTVDAEKSDFIRTQFNQCKFIDETSFTDCNFTDAEFDECNFPKQTKFTKSTFKDAIFTDCTVEDEPLTSDWLKKTGALNVDSVSITHATMSFRR